VWKKRRGKDEAVLLSRTSQWSLSESTTKQPEEEQQPPPSQQEPKHLASPSSVLQSRSRRGIGATATANTVTPDSKKMAGDGTSSQLNGASAWSRSVNRGDALAGLAALSSAALLKLDAEGK
jgi:hypothetical protein